MPTSDFHSFRTKFCCEFFKNSYLLCLLVYKKVKDSFGKLTLITFQWLTFHRRLSPISAVKPVWNHRLLIFIVLERSFVPSFLKVHISLNFWATTMLKTPLESLFWVLSHGYNFTAVNCQFWRWNRSEITYFWFSLQAFLQVLFWVF